MTYRKLWTSHLSTARDFRSILMRHCDEAKGRQYYLSRVKKRW